MPPNLYALGVLAQVDSDKSLNNLLASVPNGVQNLYFRGIFSAQNKTVKLHSPIRLPQELDIARLGIRGKWHNDDLHDLLKALPRSISFFKLYDPIPGRIASNVDLSFIIALFITPVDVPLMKVRLGINNIQSTRATHAEIVHMFRSNPDMIYVFCSDKKVLPIQDPYYYSWVEPSSKMTSLYIVGSGITDQASEQYTKFDLSKVSHLSIDNTSMTHKGIISFIRATFPSLMLLSMQSTGLTLAGVDKIIAELPEHVRQVKIRGNNIRVKGVSKFKAWARKIAETKDVVIDIVY